LKALEPRQIRAERHESDVGLVPENRERMTWWPSLWHDFTAAAIASRSMRAAL